jgi:hypothetical protein
MKQQTAVQQFWEQLEEKSWENASMNRIEICMNVEEYLALKNQAKAMHKEEIMNAHFEGQCDETEGYPLEIAKKYYNETYGGNND